MLWTSQVYFTPAYISWCSHPSINTLDVSGIKVLPPRRRRIIENGTSFLLLRFTFYLVHVSIIALYWRGIFLFMPPYRMYTPWGSCTASEWVIWGIRIVLGTWYKLSTFLKISFKKWTQWQDISNFLPSRKVSLHSSIHHDSSFLIFDVPVYFVSLNSNYFRLNILFQRWFHSVTRLSSQEEWQHLDPARGSCTVMWCDVMLENHSS